MKKNTNLVLKWTFVWSVFFMMALVSIGSHFTAVSYKIVDVQAVESISDNTDFDMTLPTPGQKFGGGFNPYAVGYAKFNSKLYPDVCLDKKNVSEYDVVNGKLVVTRVECFYSCREQTNYVEAEETKLMMGACVPTGRGAIQPIFTSGQVS